MRSWGEELWDQWDSVSSHSQKGIELLETYKSFVHERIRIESDYAKNLRKLVKSFLPKKKDEGDKFTLVAAFKQSIKEAGDMAGQHELIAEDFNSHIVLKIHELVKENKEERKKLLTEGARLQQQLLHSHQQLEKAKKNYEKSFREAEKAQDNFQKADADLNLSRAEVEKQRMNSSIKSQNCEDHKNEYANQLQKTNTLQHDHYNKLLPDVLRNFQDLDINRIKGFKSLLIKSAEIERNVYPILVKCLDGIVNAANSIDEQADSEAVIEKYKSGFTPPGDVPFDDLSNSSRHHNSGGSDCGDSNSLPGHNTSNHSSNTPNSHPPFRSDTIKGTISAARFRKRPNLFTGIFGSNKEDFNDLPPNQRRKKIQNKIDDINSKLSQERGSRDALLKMKEVYEGNPSLGDPHTITGQLTETNSAIDKLTAELEKYTHMLDNPEQPHNTSVTASPTPPSRHHHSTSTPASHHHHNGGSTPHQQAAASSSPRSSLASHRTSFSEESISRSSHSPESGISLSHNSLHGSDQGSREAAVNGGVGGPAALAAAAAAAAAPRAAAEELEEDDDEDAADDSAEFCDVEPLPVIGTCRALYNFDGVSEGSITLTEGEVLNVIELDNGDGWTRVRRQPPDYTEGFVPTSYIQCTLINPKC